ncbi:MAG: DUF1648 domain-containing protein [Clostridiales bacterium]|nr:DUF1648 domain-containing protein [Clostridiales bacterium]
MKQYKKTIIFTGIIILLPILFGTIMWSKLPDTMATHFGMDGTPNGWSSKAFVVFGLPLFLLGVHMLCVFGQIKGEKKMKEERKVSSKMYMLVLWICPLVSIICGVTMYSYALGGQMDIFKIIQIFIALLFMAVGNYLPKCRQNHFIGIKLPWTLSDEETWNHTHRVTGWLWMSGGLVLLVNILFKVDWIIYAVFGAMIIVPFVYSGVYYFLHKKADSQ